MCILEPLNVSNVVILCNCGTGTYFAIRHVCVADVFLVIEVLSGHGRSALACSLSLAWVYVRCVCVCLPAWQPLWPNVVHFCLCCAPMNLLKSWVVALGADVWR